MIDPDTIDHQLARLREVYADSPEIASWFEREPGNSYDDKTAKTRAHILGMWMEMHDAVDLIDSLRAERDALRERVERAERNRDMWKGQCERQADKLRARQEWLQCVNADPDNLEYLNDSAWDDVAALAANGGSNEK